MEFCNRCWVVSSVEGPPFARKERAQNTHRSSNEDCSHGMALGREAWLHKRRTLYRIHGGSLDAYYTVYYTMRCSHDGAYLDVFAESSAAVTVAEYTVSSSAPSTGAVQDPRVSQVRPFTEVSTKRLFCFSQTQQQKQRHLRRMRHLEQLEREGGAEERNSRTLNKV